MFGFCWGENEKTDNRRICKRADSPRTFHIHINLRYCRKFFFLTSQCFYVATGIALILPDQVINKRCGKKSMKNHCHQNMRRSRSSRIYGNVSAKLPLSDHHFDLFTMAIKLLRYNSSGSSRHVRTRSMLLPFEFKRSHILRRL